MDGVDRISALPEEIKIYILSHLSITDAVRTSVVARSWRHLWTLLPGLHADDDAVRTFVDDLHQPADGLDKISRWIGIVERFLSALRGPIRHFTLFPLTRTYHARHLDRFLDLILQKEDGLEELSIECPCYVVNRHPGLEFPYFRSLRDLRLHWVHLRLPSGFQGFDQLTTLKLYWVWISQHDINALVNQSKKLTSFVGQDLMPPYDADGEPLSVTFNCPLLKSVRFLFEETMAEARVASAPCLETAYVTATDGDASPPENLAPLAAAIMKFMADVAHVSYLSFDSTVLKCLSRVDVPHTLRVHFRQLRCLELADKMFYIDRRMYEMFCRLLKSMPCLELLKIENDYPMESDELVDPIPSNEYMKKQDNIHCLNQTLRRVTISMIKLTAIKDFMWMIYFILLNANVLELIEITFLKDDPQMTSSVIEELCGVEKASLDAKVVLCHNS